MASIKEARDCMEEFICSVCLELLNAPVILECGHNFCKACIDRFWSSEKQPSCPECRQEFPARKYTVSRLLANAIQRVQLASHKSEIPDPEYKVDGPDPGKKDSNQFCMEHEEKLKLFCQEDETLACAMCVPEHSGHTFLTLHKALGMYKDNLTTSLYLLQSKLKEYEEIKCQQEMKISEVAKIKSCPENVPELLHRVTKDQKEDNSQSVMAHELSLGVYKGPLQYDVWKEMKSILNPGHFNHSLDADTAHPKLILSENLTTMRYANISQSLPDNPERFYSCVCVLGSEGFISGRFYWEVGVRNKTQWEVGVAKESIDRKGIIRLSPEFGHWTVCLRNGKDYKACDLQTNDLSLNAKPQKIGVYLDYEGGQVSFYNADNMSHLYTFTDTFTERLYPIFSPGDNDGGRNAEPLKLFQLKL